MLWFLITTWLVDVSRIRKRHLEIKRMFVLPEVRGRGFAQSILRDLEQWGVESGFSFFFETLDRQTEAIGMYQKCGYTVIDNYEPTV
jgi:GNAT superfamily N-acetyltransferase